MTACRTIIVDDHRVFAYALGIYIESSPQFDLIGTAANGISGLELCRKLVPELVVLDVKLPKLNGLELTKILRPQFPELRILMLTAMLNPATINTVRRLKVNGFVDKAQPFDVFEEALKRIAAGDDFFSDSFLQAERKLKLDPQAPAKLLSNQQQRILALVAQGQSNREIAENLGLSVRTIESHRYRMLQILNLKSPKELFRYAFENGIGGNP